MHMQGINLNGLFSQLMIKHVLQMFSDAVIHSALYVHLCIRNTDTTRIMYNIVTVKGASNIRRCLMINFAALHPPEIIGKI